MVNLRELIRHKQAAVCSQPFNNRFCRSYLYTVSTSAAVFQLNRLFPFCRKSYLLTAANVALAAVIKSAGFKIICSPHLPALMAITSCCQALSSKYTG